MQGELDIKNQQIAAQHQQMTAQNELMKGLSERLREGNILIGSLQQQLALGDGTKRIAVVDAETNATPAAQKGSDVPGTRTSAKPNFFRRVFRSSL